MTVLKVSQGLKLAVFGSDPNNGFEQVTLTPSVPCYSTAIWLCR